MKLSPEPGGPRAKVQVTQAWQAQTGLLYPLLRPAVKWRQRPLEHSPLVSPIWKKKLCLPPGAHPPQPWGLLAAHSLGLTSLSSDSWTLALAHGDVSYAEKLNVTFNF